MIQRLTSNALVLGLTLVSFAGCGDDDDDAGSTNGGAAARGGGANAGAQSGGAGGARAGSGGGGAAGSAGMVNAGGAAGSSSAGTPAGGANGGEGAGESGAGGIDSGGVSGGGAGGTADAGGAGGAGPAANLSDGQIFLVIDTLNGGEVEVAFAALPRLANAAVEAFAQHMVMAHGTARQENAQLAQSIGITPTPSPLQMDLKAKADAQVLTFQTSPAPSLDAPYIDSQVAMHADALTLANQLFDAADNAQLRTELAGLITDISAHLTEAQALEAAIE